MKLKSYNYNLDELIQNISQFGSQDGITGLEMTRWFIKLTINNIKFI